MGWRGKKSWRFLNFRRRFMFFRRALVFGGVLILLSTALYFLKVREVICQRQKEEVSGDLYWCPDLQKDLAGQNFLFLRLKNYERPLREKYPQIRRLSLRFSFPLNITAVVQEREPLAVVAKGGIFPPEATFSAQSLIRIGDLFVDDEGYLFRSLAPASPRLPWLISQNQAEPNRPAWLKTSFWLGALKIIKELKKVGLNFLYARRSENGGLELLTDEGLAIYMFPEKEVERDLTVLQLLIEKYRIEGRKLMLIDLRFKEPVVKY